MKSDTTDEHKLAFIINKSLNFKTLEPGYIAFRPTSEINVDIRWEIFG